jgi:predicted nucleotidyltransferase
MDALDALAVRTKSDWSHLRAARISAVEEQAALSKILENFPTADASIVVLGSLARQEFTAGSDIDWTLILDGMSHPQDEKLAQDIRAALDEAKRKQPGREGVFGRPISSHDLIHNIGGEDDTNSNTTRRILLLLESVSVGRSDAHERVLNNILFRYLDEDRGLWFGSNQSKVPRFLFNDIARYWRTMAVDFAYKQRTRPNGGFLLRNTKLRMSRKLLFLAGMVACFDCHLSFYSAEERQEFYERKPIEAIISRLRECLSKPPLEMVASSLLPYYDYDGSIRKLFTAYNDFVGILADETLMSTGLTKRDHLDKLLLDDIQGDSVAGEAREISHRFRDAIAEIFLTPETPLGRLTIEYGVF